MNFRGKSTPGDLSGFLDVGSYFEGELRFEQSFRVDGKVVGKVISEGDLVVGEKGEIDGEIRVGRLFVSGLVKGEVHAARRLSIHPRGRVEGEVHARALIIEEGGILEGQSSMKAATEERSPGEAAAGSGAVAASVAGGAATPSAKVVGRIPAKP
jgi:cytoskeletal protein CcmA (bactofilin family)